MDDDSRSSRHSRRFDPSQEKPQLVLLPGLVCDAAVWQPRVAALSPLDLARKEGMRAMGRRWGLPMVHPDFVPTPMFEAMLDMIERCSPEISKRRSRPC
jgi:hypothetical protein